MSGTIHGRIEMYSNTASNINNCQEQFKGVFDFLNLRKGSKALQWGKSATGPNYWDQANPFQSNAFAVFPFPAAGSRTWSWQLLLQYCAHATEVFGNSPGNPGALNRLVPAVGMGMQAAVARTSGGADADPWKGTTLNNGADTKVSPVWGAPSGGSVYVLPRSNNERGNHNTNKENCGQIIAPSSSATRYHAFCDDDAFVLCTSTSGSGSGSLYNINYVGPYTPAPGFNPANPLVMLAMSSAFDYHTVTVGLVSGDAVAEGGIFVLHPDFPVGNYHFDRYNYAMASANWNPNPQFATPTYMEWPLPIYVQSIDFPGFGFVGMIDSPLFRHVFNWATHSVSTGSLRVCLGYSATLGTNHWTVPWDGATTPGTGATRAGIDF